jgi:hypothetical protein
MRQAGRLGCLPRRGVVISFRPRQAPIPTIITRAAGMPQARPRRYSTAKEATLMSEDMTAAAGQAGKMGSWEGCQEGDRTCDAERRATF